MGKSPSVSRVFMGDFETTVYDGQVNTEVWAAACVEMNTEDVHIFHSIDEQYTYFERLRCNVIVYYHNLKFDGAFWLSYFMVDRGFTQAAVRKSDGSSELDPENDLADDFMFLPKHKMPAKSIVYSISDMGQWYRIIVKMNKRYYLEIRDSLKLLPFSVARIGKGFKTKHQKLDMEYSGFRYAGCEISEEEKQYIANDVLVVKEALEIMFREDHKKLTIGSCCLADFKRTLSHTAYEDYFPDLYQYKLDPEVYGAETIGQYVRKSYRGGWCYLARGKERKVYTGGTTADVNSLYPSMMHSESGNVFPVGLPHFWRGNGIPPEALAFDSYYFVRIRTRFYLKDGFLPFIQVKNSVLYKATEALETSDIYDAETNSYWDHYTAINGEELQAIVEMTLTMTDFELIREHYNLVDFEILDGCWFRTILGVFDEYINKWRSVKQNSKGALRELAKLFLNNLYGKMASSPNSSFKVAEVREDKSIGFRLVIANDKQPGYIPIGSAITSYARNFTIRAAQQNYYGPDQPGFIYADTDSIHCDLQPEQLHGIKVDPTAFCCWKLEACWDQGYFVRQKTYIEHVTHENLEPVEKPYYNIKCAGMPQRSKDLFLQSMGVPQDLGELSDYEQAFLSDTRTLEDFKVGLVVPGKLLPKRIRGGVLLVDTLYQMR